MCSAPNPKKHQLRKTEGKTGSCGKYLVEVEKNEESLQVLRGKVSELGQLRKSQEIPSELQVMEADLSKKISRAREVSEQAKNTLSDFSFQKQQLDNFINQMSGWLKDMEQSLLVSQRGSNPEDISKVKEIQKELQNQQSNIDSTRENLNTLCRKYPSEELVNLGSELTELIRKYKAVNQLCTKTLSSLQNNLQLHFTEVVQEFHGWLSELDCGVRDCSDQSGDSSTLENKLQKLKRVLDQEKDGKARLTRVCEEGEKLLLHLPKGSVSQVQQHLSSSQQAWDGFVERCRQNEQMLEESAAQLNGFESKRRKLSRWLEQAEQKLCSEVQASKKLLTERKAELEHLEGFLKEVHKERDSFEQLHQESHILSESGRGDGSEARAAARLQTKYQTLLRQTKEQLRSLQLALQEHQAFEESIQSTWSWLRGVQGRLASLNNTVGSKETLEKRLGFVQDILLMKGEGEVKLNMAIGKGEQALKSSGDEGQELIRSQLQGLKDAWATTLVTAMSCHSRLEWTVAQWNGFQEAEGQLLQWMELAEREVAAPLALQLGLREKAAQLDRIRAALADAEGHAAALARLAEKGTELHKKTGDQAFRQETQEELTRRFADITAVIKGRVKAMEDFVEEHEQYLEAVREFGDWLTSAKEELQRWSDTSGDSVSVQKKLSKVQELLDSKQRGRERLTRVQHCGLAARKHTAAAGREPMEHEEAALLASWEEWERAVLWTRDVLESALSQAVDSERELSRLAAHLERDLQGLGGKLEGWRHRMSQVEGMGLEDEAVQAWQIAKDTLEGLQEVEPLLDSLKSQLNDLCRFSRDVGAQSEEVSALIKEYNSLSLQASLECQTKEKLLEHRFRNSFKDFHQWLVNAKINTAKCFEVPQNIAEVSAALVKLQEFLNDREQGQAKLNGVVFSGEQLIRIVAKDRLESIRAKMSSARNDWKALMSNLHQREASLQNLQAQMKDFEASAEPLQGWLNATETAVREIGSNLESLAAKKQELNRLQCVQEEIASQDFQLSKLKEKAGLLWEGQVGGKGFMHRVSQLSAQYQALANHAKEKASRVDRIVTEHQLFSQSLKELQDWVADTNHMLQNYCMPTADKNVLDSRMTKLESLLMAWQEKEIQLKMLVARGEAVQKNTSPTGIPMICKQIQDLKESWDLLLSASIQCKSQLEGALSQWTSYQEDVRQFVGWMERVEESLRTVDRQNSEMRDKTANLSKAKLLHEDVLSHSSLLDTIVVKSSSMAEHYVTKLEVQDLQEHYMAVKDKAMHAVDKAEELLLAHQEYQRSLQVFQDWLEEEQETLTSCFQLEGDVEMLENTLQKLQELQVQCTEGQALMNGLLDSRERVVPWGAPQIEDRILETAQQEWQAYQAQLAECRAQLNGALAKLRQLEQKFQRLDKWLKGMESKADLRSQRRSDKETKEAQLQLLKGWQEEILVYQEEVEGLCLLAQQVLEESHISSRVSTRAAQLTSRYHALVLHLSETTKQLEEEVCSIEEAHVAFNTLSDWLRIAQENFRTVTTSIAVVDRGNMEKKMKKLEGLQGDMELGHSYLKVTREKTERAVAFLEEAEAEKLRGEVDAQLAQLESLKVAMREEHSFLEKGLQLSKEFLDKYKAQAQWMQETKAVLHSPVEPKVELYEKKAQLAKYKTIQQTVQSRESAVKSVSEKGEALLDTVQDPYVAEKMTKLQEDYQDLCRVVQAHVESLVNRVNEHEAYNIQLQEVEKWLLQMSSRLVNSESMQCGSLEVATQQLARHKAVMEEITSFEERLANLKDSGEHLIASSTEHLRPRVQQQVQAHQQGARDSYAAICSTAQRVYQSLDRELQKHVSHQDTLQQCQAWLSTVQEELLPQATPILGLQEALKQVKHFRALQEQASTYLDLVCSVCDLTDEAVRRTAAEVQRIKLTIEESMLKSQDLADRWKEIKEQKSELGAHLQDLEQQLQSFNRRPAELEMKIAENMLSQAKELSQHLKGKQGILTQMTESVSRLTEGQDSPEQAEIEHLSHTWLELCHQANLMLCQREEDLQRTKDYHDCISAVEVLFDQVSKEWDSLARTDAESSFEHLEALKKLSVVLDEQRGILDNLKDHRQRVISRLNLDDKELVKEQTGHFEQRWTQLESLIEKNIEDSERTLENMSQVEFKLREVREWAEEQQPTLSEAMKLSPPPELAQSFLFDHLSICSEMEAKQLLLAQALADADRVLAHLGLSERQRLQQMISDTQTEIESLSIKVIQRRKYLSKAFTERTQFLLAVSQAIAWVQQNEKKALAEEHIALLPDDLSKQIRICKGIQSSLKAYQSELTSLWSQGRDLMKDATEDEKTEILTKLQELQSIFETALQKCCQKVQELEKALGPRKYFKMDLEKTCQWLKQADIVTFPEINLMNGDTELHSQLTKYEEILNQAAEYENLLLTVQRTGQEILPTLNEVDHCYLDEKLNSLPKQYNNILALAREKEEKIQQAIAARKEYASLIEITHKALKGIEEQFNTLGNQPVGLMTEDVSSLQSDYKDLLEDLTNLGPDVVELNQKKEAFRSTGQPWRPDEMVQLVNLYNSLKRLIEQRIEHLDDTLESFEDHKAMALQLDSELKATKEQLDKVNAETQSAEERLKNYHALAGSLQGATSHMKRLTEQMDSLASHVDQAAHQAARQQVVSWQEELQSLQSAVGELIVECENRYVQSKDFQTEVRRTLDWLQQVRDELGCAVILDVKVERVQEEIRKQQIMQEEVQSRLRIVAALSSREKQKYASANELVPAHVDTSLEEMAKLEADVQQALNTKQITLEQALSLCQKYHSKMQYACEWLEDAVAFLQQASLGVDVENYEECLRQQSCIMATEQDFLGNLQELETLPPQLESLVNSSVKEQLRLSVESAQQRGVEVRDQLQYHQDVLHSCVAQWKSFQEARQTVIELMNEAEKQLTQFSTAKAATCQEAEDKLKSHKSLVSLVNGFHDKLTDLEEQASQLEMVGSDASKATISRSMTMVWQRWNRLRNVARGQEKVLEDTALEWRSFKEKMAKTTVILEDLQGRVPERSVEKVSKAALQALLEYIDSFIQEVEREQSSLTLLRQYGLSLLRGMEMPMPTSAQDELPYLQEIRVMQEHFESLLQEVREGRLQARKELNERDEVEKELGQVKLWIQDTLELLLSSSTDMDTLLQELEVVHGELISHRQSVEKITEQQQSKYLDLYTILPSEISIQLAEVSLALGSIEDQVHAKEREIQQIRDIQEDFSSKIHDVSERMGAISMKLKEKSTDLSLAKEETEDLCEDLDICGQTLSDLDGAIQEFAERNPLLSRQLSDAIIKLNDLYHTTSRLAHSRAARLKNASAHLDEFNEMLEYIVTWIDKGNKVMKSSIVWNSASQLQEQIKVCESVLWESRELHRDLEAMKEKTEVLSEVLQTTTMDQQVSDLSRQAEELQQSIELQLHSLQDAAKDMECFEREVKALHAAVEQAQVTLTTPELAHLSLKEQLAQRQRLLTEMESFKQQALTVQGYQSALRIPEEVVTSLSICRTALGLQHEASRLQHTAIQQCNILQEAVVQYEQYEQEVRHLQKLIEEAHQVIQDQPISTSNIQELQAQILHHEELAQKIKGYQEQITSLNSKCKMLTMKAKHAAMLLTVHEGLVDTMDEVDAEILSKGSAATASVTAMAPGRGHMLLSPVTEESGEEATSSEISSPPSSYSPYTESFFNQITARRGQLTRTSVQELYDPTLEPITVPDLDDLQRSWESLKNVISEKQRTLYEALERQKHCQDALQSISAKMEVLEAKLSEGLEAEKSPERQMEMHQVQMDTILSLQAEIDELQACFADHLVPHALGREAAEHLAARSSLTVLAERLATIRMKASGKQHLLEERLSERMEDQRLQQALQRCHSEADELECWLRETRAALASVPLIHCQNVLLELEQKVAFLTEMSARGEGLRLEGKATGRQEAELLATKLRMLKGGLLELQRILQDKQISVQGSQQQVEDAELDSTLPEGRSVQDWLAEARTTRSLQYQDSIQRQKELEEQLEEQKKLLQSVASRGEELLTKQATPSSISLTDTRPVEQNQEEGKEVSLDQMRQKWESLKKHLGTKLQLLQDTLRQEPKQPVYSRTSRVTTSGAIFKGDAQARDKSSLRSLFEGVSQAFEDVLLESGISKRVLHPEQQLYSAILATSSWLDSVESNLLSGAVLLTEDAETQLYNQEALGKDLNEVTEEVGHSRQLLVDAEGFSGERQMLVEETLDSLTIRLKTLDSVLMQRCEEMRARLQELTAFQTELRLLYNALTERKYQILQRLAEGLDQPASEQVEIIAEAEESLKEFEHRIAELKTRGDDMQPDQISTQELLKLQDIYEELVMTVGSRRSGINQNLALKGQYERALQDLADLVDTAQDKIATDQKIIAGSVEEVQNLLDKHKEFFQGLESHMILTETFFRKISSFVLPPEKKTLEDTLANAQVLLKQAHKRGVKLEYVLEAWNHLEKDYQTLHQQLEDVESRIPSVGLAEETEEKLNERIELYQHLKVSLTEHQHKLCQVLEDGKRLLLSVCCSNLEAKLTQLGEHWLSHTTRVNKELHHLDSILKHWTRYQCESSELNRWLQSALEHLEFWASQSTNVSQELEDVRDQLSAFLEFSKEVETKSALKASVLNEGNQLLRLKKVDTEGLRAALAQVETQWSELLTRIPVVQEKLHQLQMEKLASRHAIMELMGWISLMENVIREDEEKIAGVAGSDAVQQYLQKYMCIKIDVNCKQLTVDFVNQSVLQISSQDAESKRSDRTDFAERLGSMNHRWQILKSLINEKVDVLEGLHRSWLEYESSIENLKAWFTAQEERLKKKQGIEDLPSIQNALKDLQELEAIVKEKEKDLERIEEKGCALIHKKTEEVCTVVMDTLQDLNHSWANLDHLIGQLKLSLKSVMDQWNLYKNASEEINGFLMEGKYSVSRFRLLTGSLEAVSIQVENLQNLQEELEKQENSLRKFGSMTHQLLKECHPSVANTLNNALKDVNTRWNELQEEIMEQLNISKALQLLWQHYKELYDQCASSVQQQEESADHLLKIATRKDIADEEVSAWIHDCNELLQSQKSVQGSLQVLHELGEQLKQQVDASAVAAIQSDRLSLSQRLATVEQTLGRQQTVLKAGVQDYERFSEQLDSLDRWITEAEGVLKEPDPNCSSDLSTIQDRMKELKGQMLKFSNMAPDLERLNELGYRLPLSDKEIKRMQSLNRSWSITSIQTTERFSKLQAFLLQQQTFLEKCETWMEFLVQTEEKLAVEISGNYQSLMEQQKAHELFQAEMFSRQQVLHSIISDGQRLLEQGQVDDRDEFNLKLALLSNQWQGVVRRAQQRRGIIDSLIRQWQCYREMAEKLRKWLLEVSQQTEVPRKGSPVPLQQARATLDEMQLKEKVLQRQQGSYILTVEAGRQLLLSADSGAEAALQRELTDIQERWRSASLHLEEQKRELAALLEDWDTCDRGIGRSLEKLRAFKRKLAKPLPDRHGELHSEQIRCKELENTLDEWKDDTAHLTLLKESLSSYISADDLSVLQERLELLQRQWEELSYQLSLRRQQVSEKLNEWAVFSERHRELSEWLTQMESKVSQAGDISIEEMIEKLRKDYQEEIAAAEENKQQLQQMGERLARLSPEGKAAEIEAKLSRVRERWQHLLDLVGARLKKLRETLTAVQQLDKNMSGLRSWLAHIETELSRPIIYDSCTSSEIQRKLDQQQDLQRDIEKHSTGVASVLNLCEVLLHDCDACATDTECESIQQATRSLDRRWRNICAVSMERRLKIEETERLWKKFQDDFTRFENWLTGAERTAALPNSSEVLYTVAKEELKKFEAFQRHIHENLTQLEHINKQYRRLARENRTDSSCHLREMVRDGNQRWDGLQRRVASVLRRLKHFINQREEFEAARDSILVWLTEMDLQLTNIEHFSDCDVQAKMKQLKAFQQEIALNTGKMEQIFRQGEALIEKSEPLDATVIEEEVEELQRYCQEVFGRVERYYKKLIHLPLAEDEHDVSDPEDAADLSSLPWNDSLLSPLPSSSRSASVAALLRAERSGQDTPASVDSIPLEWDHDYDLSRGLETMTRSLASESGAQLQDEDEDFLLGAASTLSSEAGSLETHIRRLGKALDTSRFHLQQTENIIRSRTPTGPELESTYMGYMRLLGECRGSIETVRRVGFELKEKEDEMSGLANPISTETQTSGVIERWELIQAQALSKELRMKQNLQQWQQFKSDLGNVWAWLCQAGEELEELRRLDVGTDIQTIEERIKKLKELHKALDQRKAIILSINLCSAEFLRSDGGESQELQTRLKEMNNRWDRLGTSLEEWRGLLQEALMQCQDFHEMSHGLLLWLENIDRRRNEIVPIDFSLDSEMLHEHHKRLTQIRRELLDSQQKVTLLQDMSSQLLVHSEGSDCLEAKEKVHVIGNRLKLLLKEVTRDIRGLEKALDISSSQQDLSSWSSADELDTSGSLSPVSGRSTPSRQRPPRGKCSLSQPGTSVRSPHRRSRGDAGSASSHSETVPESPAFLRRVLRAALPFQLLLLLLLLGLACLAPASENRHGCPVSNGLTRSLHPTLRYTDGPPPV
ncbi:nesprin-1 isoform X5 [Scleropages formosus]|uniref:nesprin-1 isoform X5 n=1 Tax=Scleropages formosus TaxID=113540 RepID=UPI0010FA81C7|nr:nesprin-1-like isoform X5 [Scleropages formosus]